MIVDWLKMAFGLGPPTNPPAGFFENLWKCMTTCESYEIFPRPEMCSGLMNDPLFTGFLLLSFVLLILAIFYIIFPEEIKDLTEMRNQNQVNNQTDSLSSLRGASWNLKDLTIRFKKEGTGAECCKRKEVSGPILLLSGSRKVSDVVTEKKIIRKRLVNVPKVELSDVEESSSKTLKKELLSPPTQCKTKKANSEEENLTNNVIFANYSEVADNTSKKYKKELLRLPEEHKIKKEDRPSNYIKLTKGSGSFPERKKIPEELKATKSVEQTKSNNDGSEKLTPRSIKTFTNTRRTPKDASKKGIFNKSKFQQRKEVLNIQKNI